MIRHLRWKQGLSVAAIVTVFAAYPLYAVTEPSSANYKLDETTMGITGNAEASSTNYSSRAGAGDLSIGNAASTNFQVEAGSHTTPDPYLSVQITNANADFGSFSPGLTATATATFSVINYTSYGYAVIITGDTLKNGSYSLPAMTSTAAAQAGTEQFGLNIVANTAPIAFGANLNNGGFGFGAAAPSYATANQFRFVSGESIATAPKSSGKTDYTISYIANVNGRTPGGQYSGKQTIVVTGTY